MRIFKIISPTALTLQSTTATPIAAATPAPNTNPAISIPRTGPAAPVCPAELAMLLVAAVPFPILAAVVAAACTPKTPATKLASALTTLVLNASTSLLTPAGKLATHSGSANVKGGFVAKEYKSWLLVKVGKRVGRPAAMDASAVPGTEPRSSTSRAMEVAAGPCRMEDV